jgi:hypothetical protein
MYDILNRGLVDYKFKWWHAVAALFVLVFFINVFEDYLPQPEYIQYNNEIRYLMDVGVYAAPDDSAYVGKPFGEGYTPAQLIQSTLDKYWVNIKVDSQYYWIKTLDSLISQRDFDQMDLNRRFEDFNRGFPRHVRNANRSLGQYMVFVKTSGSSMLVVQTSLYPAGALEERLASLICYTTLDHGRRHGFNSVSVWSANERVMKRCSF